MCKYPITQLLGQLWGLLKIVQYSLESIHSLLLSWSMPLDLSRYISFYWGYGSTQDVIDGPHCIFALFFLLFSYQSVPKQKCQTTYENKCSTTYETTYEYVSKDKCTTEYVQECKPSYGYGGQECKSVPKQKCYKVCTIWHFWPKLGSFQYSEMPLGFQIRVG